jgi:hypothetical protein
LLAERIESLNGARTAASEHTDPVPPELLHDLMRHPQAAADLLQHFEQIVTS